MKKGKKNELFGAPVVVRRLFLGVAAAMLWVPWWAGANNVPELSDIGLSELPQQDLAEPVLGSLRTALDAYEATRSDLAGDQLAVLPVSASALAGALRLTLEDQTGLSASVSGVIEEAALAAESLAQAKDLVAARETFGEVSRLLMVLAGGDPRLTEGWHVFACPMVETFAKWLQPTTELENPYMGPAMPKCGFATDWSLPARSAAEEALASARSLGTTPTSVPEPEFEPGISGLKMVDVRDHKFLWREIDELQIWERGERITVREYRSKAIEKTAHYLELEGEVAANFVNVSSELVAGIRASFKNRPALAGSSSIEGKFRSDLREATARLGSLLHDEPRHQLFAPECKKWLLKLAFGPKEAKEAREAREAKASGHV